MDELLIYVTGLLEEDDGLKAIAAGAGCDGSLVTTPAGRALARYPRIVVSGDEGAAQSFSDNLGPQITRGTLRLEIVTRRTDTQPFPLATLREIQKRMMLLLTGSATEQIAPINGLLLYADEDNTAAAYQVVQFYQIRPTGFLPKTDPDYERHVTTFFVQLYKLEPTG